MNHKLIRCLGACFLGVSLVGCGGGNLGQVEGTVTLDDQPLPDATVIFQPEAGGSPSRGKTDASGYYQLSFSRDEMGAVPGTHTVRISTGGVVGSEEEGEEGEPVVVPEKVPAKYNDQSELTASVEKGSNTIDFDLDAQGEIAQIEIEEDF
ncbi:MAG: carboxypeptidase-like regulatory domain-containing protein [Planctomycetes bacterium]|nr:carboxypeptidase-like regulatory domain-containing protein [Planctomycetota bacterium]